MTKNITPKTLPDSFAIEEGVSALRVAGIWPKIPTTPANGDASDLYLEIFPKEILDNLFISATSKNPLYVAHPVNLHRNVCVVLKTITENDDAIKRDLTALGVTGKITVTSSKAVTKKMVQQSSTIFLSADLSQEFRESLERKIVNLHEKNVLSFVTNDKSAKFRKKLRALLQKTYVFKNASDALAVKIAHHGMTEAMIRDNLMAVMNQLNIATRFYGGWSSIKNVSLRTGPSHPVAIYKDNDPAVVKVAQVQNGRKKRKSDRSDESAKPPIKKFKNASVQTLTSKRDDGRRNAKPGLANGGSLNVKPGLANVGSLNVKPVLAHGASPNTKPVLAHGASPNAKPVLAHGASPNAKPVLPHGASTNAKPVLPHGASPNAKPVLANCRSTNAKPVLPHGASPNAKPVLANCRSTNAKPVLANCRSTNAKPVLPHGASPNAKPVLANCRSTNAKPVLPHGASPNAKPVLPHGASPNTKPVLANSRSTNAKPALANNESPKAKQGLANGRSPSAKRGLENDAAPLGRVDDVPKRNKKHRGQGNDQEWVKSVQEASSEDLVKMLMDRVKLAVLAPEEQTSTEIAKSPGAQSKKNKKKSKKGGAKEMLPIQKDGELSNEFKQKLMESLMNFTRGTELEDIVIVPEGNEIAKAPVMEAIKEQEVTPDVSAGVAENKTNKEAEPPKKANLVTPLANGHSPQVTTGKHTPSRKKKRNKKSKSPHKGNLVTPKEVTPLANGHPPQKMDCPVSSSSNSFIKSWKAMLAAGNETPNKKGKSQHKENLVTPLADGHSPQVKSGNNTPNKKKRKNKKRKSKSPLIGNRNTGSQLANKSPQQKAQVT